MYKCVKWSFQYGEAWHSSSFVCCCYHSRWHVIPDGSACGTEFIEGSDKAARQLLHLHLFSGFFPWYFLYITVKLRLYRQLVFDKETRVCKASSNITACILVGESRDDCLLRLSDIVGKIIRLSTKYMRFF
jgi:hypothetical protein